MKYVKYIVIVLVVITGHSYLYSQVNVEFERQNFKNNISGFKEAVRCIENADIFYEMGGGGYSIALRDYLKANAVNPNNALLNYKIGVCYLNSAYKDSSLSYLEKSQKLDPDVMPDLMYMIGRAYHLRMEFTKAIDIYNRYRNSLTGEQLTSVDAKIRKRITECEYGIKMKEKPVNVEILSVGNSVNSQYPDYRPLISADESMMIFTSRRPNTTGGERSPYDMQFFEDIYISYNVDGKWQPAQNIGPALNTPDHDAAAGISANGQDMFLYQGGLNGGDLLLCQLHGNEWQRTNILEGDINTEFKESSASFSFDGNTLFFVSNRNENSVGGGDIYMCRKNPDGKWSKPENLGNAINTPYEEASIFMHPDGRTMYYSSQGFNSMGGFDIFRATMDSTGKWGNPVNMGYPINTPDDDVFFVISGSGKHGYYSSFRMNGEGEKDIYMIDFKEDTTETYPPGANKGKSKLTLLKGTVKDGDLMIPLEAEIEIVDNKENKVIFTSKCNSTTGKFLVSLPSGKNYGIAAKADGYLFHSENFNIPDTAAFQVIEKNILLYKVKVGSKMVLKNIFFDFDKATLRDESVSELTRLINLMNQYPNLRVEISGHTDNKGSLEYNTNLSQSRAKSVVDYLVKNGISSSRLEYKGYAFKMPMTTNDTEEGRQMNRRVEFKIIGN